MHGGGWHGKPAEGEYLKACALAELDERRIELTSGW